MRNVEETFFEDAWATITLPEKGTKVIIGASSIGLSTAFFAKLCRMFRGEEVITRAFTSEGCYTVDGSSIVQFVEWGTIHGHESNYTVVLADACPRILLNKECGIVETDTQYNLKEQRIRTIVYQ